MKKNKNMQSNKVSNKNNNKVDARSNNNVTDCNKQQNVTNIGFEDESKSFELDDNNDHSFELR